MIKTITKVGNSHALIFDRALLDLARLKPGDKVNVIVREEGTIVIEPLRESVTPDEARSAARGIIARNDELFRRLSK
jgi:antitoxin component of MazEF toxin-antitoxin module